MQADFEQYLEDFWLMLIPSGVEESGMKEVGMHFDCNKEAIGELEIV